MFDSLSKSIDDAFVIRDAKSGEIVYRSLNMERVLGISPTDETLYQGLKSEDVDEIYRYIGDFELAASYKKISGIHKTGWRKTLGAVAFIPCQ